MPLFIVKKLINITAFRLYNLELIIVNKVLTDVVCEWKIPKLDSTSFRV